jgi:hypothetical protein
MLWRPHTRHHGVLPMQEHLLETPIVCHYSAPGVLLKGGPPHLHLAVAAPDGELEHELLNGAEESVDGRQAGGDDHIPGGLRRHKGVAIAVAAHPRPKVE